MDASSKNQHDEDATEETTASSTESGSPAASGIDRRTAPRYIFQVPVTIQAGRAGGKGRVHDMSSSGARIEDADLKCSEGTRVRLRFRFFKDSPPMELSGEVARVTATGGFCVHFGKLDPRTRRALATLLPKVGAGRCEDEPELLFSGELVTNLGPTLHRACVEAARAAGIPLNEWIKGKLAESSQSDLADLRKPDPPPQRTGPARNPYQR